MARYDFQSPGAEAAAAIQQVLLARAVQQRQQEAADLARQHEAEQNRQAADRLALDQQQEARIAADSTATRQRATDQQQFENDVRTIGFMQPGDPLDAGINSRLESRGVHLGKQPPPTQGTFLGNDDNAIPQYDVQPGRIVYAGTPEQQEKARREHAIGDLLTDPTLTDTQRNAVKLAQATGDFAGIAALFKPATNEPVYRQNPRTGTIEQVGSVPTGSHFMTEPAPKDTSFQDAGRLDRSFQFNSTQLEKVRTPIAQAVDRMARLTQTLGQNSPQADALVAPELLTVMAGGMGTGLRMTEAEISRVIGGRTEWENLKAKIGRYSLDPSKGFALTPEQRQQVGRLVTEVGRRNQTKLDALDRAGDDLVGADSVDAHRRIVAGARRKLTAIDQGTDNANMVTLVDPKSGATRQVDRNDPRYAAYIKAGAQEVR